MKSIILLTVLFFTTFLAQAQANNENVSLEIETVQVEMIEAIDTENTMEVARLYKNKNNRVIKALKFSTKLNNAKLS
ncbi:hypothetical protein LCGC14_0067760 [marine sediment metagenome]|uniref:Uncharacterized protein n=1 Tax=marine sediment metagenome TaxID=412755 RepID=A0A0F9Y3G9_9ZZZZ|nr:hypothetical protein [Maribacter sp.]HDZ04152.1 hypothetical protein [Maribacter sp.]